MTTDYLRTWVSLNKNAFARNLACFAKIVGPHVKISLVVKSNAYGHGLLPICTMSNEHEAIHALCTAMTSEAIFLRCNGVRKPILSLGIIDNELSDVIMHNIDILVSDTALLDKLNAVALRLKKVCNVHIKVDTGLGRLGIPSCHALSLIMYAKTLSHINVNGICSHFAQAAAVDQSYTQFQYDSFMALLMDLKSKNIDIPYRHITNTASSTTYDLSSMNMIRTGAGVYGLLPSESHRERTLRLHPYYEIEQVLSWHTRIFHIRRVPGGTSIGYDRTFTTQQESLIALLPVGYADGYDKRLSNQAVVYIPRVDKYVKVIGRVAMNVTTIDVSSVPDIQPDEEVLLVGPQSEIQASHLAQLTGSCNPREITLGINPSIGRIVIDRCTLSDACMQSALTGCSSDQINPLIK